MKPKTILVVDDEFYTADILTYVLEAEGFRTLSAFNGLDGLQKLKLSTADLIILDVMMPIMDGAEMARAVSKDQSLATIPLLVTSALSEATVRGMFTHLDGFLRKPFLVETVTSKVRTLLGEGRPGNPAAGVRTGDGSQRNWDSGLKEA